MATVTKTLPSSVKKKSAAPPTKKKVGDGLADFKLSTTISTPPDEFQDYSTLLFGAKKIGKTTLASKFPNTYFARTEPGTKALRVRGDDVLSWKMFRKMVRLLKADSSRTVVVDTVDNLFKLCDKHVCAQLGIDHVSEEAWGKGWAAQRKEFEEGITELLNIGKGVILISHATEKEIERRDGTKYHRIQPTMANVARDICEALVDIWGYFDYDGHDRMLTIGGDEHITAGHRLDERFRYDGKHIDRIYMGDEAEVGFKNLMDAFNNRYIPRPQDLVAAVEEETDTPAPPKKIKLKKKVKA